MFNSYFDWFGGRHDAFRKTTKKGDLKHLPSTVYYMENVHSNYNVQQYISGSVINIESCQSLVYMKSGTGGLPRRDSCRNLAT